MTKKPGDAVCFIIPYPNSKRGMVEWNKRFTLNAYWAGKHHRARAQDARYIHSLTMAAMEAAKIKKVPFSVPVEVIFRWDDRLDCDHHAALGKMILDRMKKRVVVDDNSRWVRRVTHEFWDGKAMGVEVRPWA